MNKLTTKQSAFVDAVRAAGFSNPVKRSDLNMVANDLGMKYAPAWIVQNSTCRSDIRGHFNVPELGSDFEIAAPAAAAPVQGTPAPVAAPAPSMNAEISAIRGVTAGNKSLVPDRLSTYVPWGHHDTCETVIKSGMFAPMYVTGLSGNGKTTMIQQACASLRRECFRVNITSATDEDDLLGGFRLINGETVWQDGPVTTAMRRGAVLLIDEIDLGGHLMMCLQPVLEGKGVYLKKVNEFVEPAAGFTIFATANTKGKGSDDGRFAGTNVMNEAMLDRFDWTLEQEYAPKGTEKKILLKKMKSFGREDKQFAGMLADWAQAIRKGYEEGHVDEIITTRRLENICKAFAIFDCRETAINMALARFDDDTRTAFRDFYAKLDDTIGGSDDASTNVADLAPDTIMNLEVGYANKELVKVEGARWNDDTKKWYVTAKMVQDNPDVWSIWNPTPAIETETVTCPF